MSKPDAFKAWKSVKPELQAVLSGLSRWRACDQWAKDDGKFIPYPATWLRREGWNDAVAGEKVEPSVADVEASRRRYQEAERQLQERMRLLTEDRRRQLGLGG